ncbi:hypothetical protein EDB84DRAFT_1472358 [Lactarius hengduanensis]|nr:hypothetical protein EDB84DRAFT_1472358 [Lactarius hengduanensis]
MCSRTKRQGFMHLALLWAAYLISLACGPSGNFRNTEYENMAKTKAKTKCHLFLGKPVQTWFADDFDKVIRNCSKQHRVYRRPS